MLRVRTPWDIVLLPLRATIWAVDSSWKKYRSARRKLQGED